VIDYISRVAPGVLTLNQAVKSTRPDYIRVLPWLI